MNLRDQILAAIDFGSLTSIVVTAGLALVGLAFLSFVLRTAQNAATGNLGDSRSRSDDDEEEDYRD